jgi:hypothetical protein
VLLALKHIVAYGDTLLGNDREICGYTRNSSGKRLRKHVPAKQTTKQRPLLGSRLLIKQQLDNNNGRAVFSMQSVLLCYKQVIRLELSEFYPGACEERT